MNRKDSKVKEIFCAALEKKTAAERSAYLDGACMGNDKLRGQVEALLKAHEEAGNKFLKEPAGVDITLDDSALTEGPGTKIGRYKLLQQIGEGGFGVVYMAEQERPIRRKVALKIIKLGMDTKQVIARFEAERQALAMMDHSNIAKVLDAGATDTGRPYFVMELVKGVPITEYCDSNNLSTEERLRLFMDVCKAVQHAHQKGIIHRDIKPTNVMITLRDGVPVPKVIDFGIAKATQHRLTEKTLFTEFRQLVGTPEYMSPEQAEMSELDIDTRSDIYSLGVLLYELLTGTTPFDAEELRSAAFDEIVRIIREKEPPRPSTRLSTLGDTLTDIARHRHVGAGQLRKIVRGELDWIVMKTLEKDRTRRYETANELARDVERFLSDEPVTAGPPSTVYRIRKFVRRNRTAVAVVLSIMLALVVGLSLAMVGFVRASQERNRAVAAEADALRQRDLTEEQRQIAQTNFKMSFNAMEEMLKVVRLPVDVVGMEREEALEGLVGEPKVEEVRDKLLQKAQVLYEGFLEKNKVNPAARVETARAYDWLGKIHEILGQYKEGEQAYQKAVNIHEELVEEFPEEYEYHQHNLAVSLGRMGDFLRNAGRVKEGQQTYQRAFFVWAKLVELAADNAHYRNGLGECYRKIGELEKAVAEYTKAIELDAHNTYQLRMRGECHFKLGELEQAAADFTKAIELNPGDSWYWHMRGECYLELGELDKAVVDLTKAIELQPDNWISYNKRGDAYLKQEQWEKALSDHVQTIMARKYNRGPTLDLFTYPDYGQWDEVLEKYTMAVKSEPSNYQHLKRRGIAYGLLGRWVQAEEDFTRAISLNPKAAELYQNRGYVYMRAGGKWEEMAADYSKAIELVPQSTWYWHERGFANGWLGKWEEMAADYSKVISFNPYSFGGWERRSIAYTKLGEYEKAIADYRKAVEVAMESTRQFPKEPEYPSSRLASCANRLAWGLVTKADVSRSDAATAVELAEKAVQAKAEESTYWNTLGAAYYRAGSFEDSIRALRKSREVGTSRHKGTDLFFTAMAEFQLGRKDEARESYDEAVEWMEQHKPGDEELGRFGAEAAELLGIAEDAVEKEVEIEK